MDQEKKEFWIGCRATPNCSGNWAVRTNLGQAPEEMGGGRIVRYRCKTCNKIWQVRV